MTWWQRVRRRARLEDELDAELRFHFDRLVADSMADGLSEEEARRRARAEFGGVETDMMVDSINTMAEILNR